MNTELVPARSPERKGISNGSSISGPAVVSKNASNLQSNNTSGPASSHSSNGTRIAPTRYVRFGDFHLDLENEELFRDGSRVKLQGKVYQALVALLERPGEIVTREALRMRLWPSDTHVNYDANVNTTVNKLRQVLGTTEDGPSFVDTIPRKGYSFVAKVEYVDRPAPRLARPLPELASCAADGATAGPRTLFLGADIPSKWFIAGVISLLLAGMLFGAALMMFVRRFM
jgi:DNA-binding winged helix-turn-helix (wHTH) protein